MGHDHHHGSGAARAGARHVRPLAVAFGLTAGFFVVEGVAAFSTNSLALLSDAGHMLTDVVGLGMALAAIQLASRVESQPHRAMSGHTFGLYRLEILAAFVNSLLLFAVGAWVLVDATRRLLDPPEVEDGAMLVVAVLGLIVNVIGALLLREGSEESLNVEGAYLEVLADALGSVGVIVAALALRWFGWTWMDPVAAIAIGVWILPRSWRLGRRSVRVLLQAAPEGLDLDAVETGLAAIDGVIDVHDLHVWTLTSDMDAASAHLVVSDDVDGHSVLDQARQLLSETHGIHHGTFQVEPRSHDGCQDLAW